MTDTAKQTLHDGLPQGWLPEAEKRLADKGTPFTRGTISKTKNGEHENQVIMDVLIDLVREETIRVAGLESRIMQAAGK